MADASFPHLMPVQKTEYMTVFVFARTGTGAEASYPQVSAQCTKLDGQTLSFLLSLWPDQLRMVVTLLPEGRWY